MKALQTIKEKAGNLLKRTSNFLSSNIKSVYAILITSILFLGLNLKHQAEYSILLLEVEKSYIKLDGDYRLGQQINKEQSDFIDFHGDINHNLRKINSEQELALENAREAINSIVLELNYQKTMVQKLVEYLKSIEEWPPKIAPPARPQPINPDKTI